MPIVPPQSAPFAQILDATLTRAAEEMGIDRGYVRVVASDDYKITAAEDRMVYIRPYGFSPFGDGGAGRLARKQTRRIRFYLYTRQGVDDVGGDEIALMGTEPTAIYASGSPIGHFVAEDTLFNAFDDWMPLSRVGSALALEPFHPMDSAGGPPERDPMRDAGFIRSSMDFECNYIQSQDTSEPPS